MDFLVFIVILALSIGVRLFIDRNNPPGAIGKGWKWAFGVFLALNLIYSSLRKNMMISTIEPSQIGVLEWQIIIFFIALIGFVALRLRKRFFTKS